MNISHAVAKNHLTDSDSSPMFQNTMSEHSFEHQAGLARGLIADDFMFELQRSDVLSQKTTPSNEFTKELIRRLDEAERTITAMEEEHRTTLQSIASLAADRR